MKDKFFTKLDWGAFWTATLVTMVVYFWTLGPSVGLEDSGELATAGAHLGVPHPPGYPFWTLCSWIFCKLFFWVTYMGHPSPAWCISLFSATAGAFAAGCTAMLICRSSRDFVGEDEPSTKAATDFTPVLAFGGGVAGALTFALSPVEWSQSTIVEIYSLNALFLMWVFLLSYRWMRRPSDKILWTTAFVFGLGLTNYQVLLFAIVPLAIMILFINGGMFRDVFIYLMPVALTYQVLQIGSLMQANSQMAVDVIAKHNPVLTTASAPSGTMLTLGVVVLVGSLVVAAVLRGRGCGDRARNAALYGGGVGAVLLLLSATLFTGKHTWSGISVPIAPLIEPWRYAFIAALIAVAVVCCAVVALDDDEEAKLSDSKYQKYLAIAILCGIAAVLVAVAVPTASLQGYTGPKYPWMKSTLVFWTLIVALFVMCACTKKGLCFAIPVAALQISAFTLLKHGAMNGLTHPCSWWFGWPIAWNFVLLALAWLTLPNGRSVAGAAFFAQLGVSFYAYMPIVSDLRNPPMNWGYPRTWEGFKHAIMRGQYEAIGFQLPTWVGIRGYFKDVMLQFTDVLVPFALVPFACGHHIVRKSTRPLFWKWMVAALSCFLLMSVLLIGLANVKGDIQDGFIQKVKFISSHAMIALWIGYGIVLGSYVFTRTYSGLTSGRRKWLAWGVSLAFIAVALVFPIVDNYTNDQLVFELGGNEQNGHTFGWQFGAYQLEGANAIKEQLIADEEPLPDPEWPEPMEKSSIFFGGTDPGRFVPTYMIYSANFRPDVYLITQNALADDTYMSVERDLYGNEIWIPAKEDSAEAFNIYVDEVQRGVRQANGDLKIENGRVQVTGALGVMEINGILTKMMFDHDRLKHSFYIEESYVIPWMYPYLSPHGLIMRINPNPTPYEPQTAAKDRDFWDWYTRRLLKDPMYRRDFAGQKSFSKLRAALAGLYAKQGRRQEAAQAFREACLLYPASPEASFRYAQEILMPARKWDEVLELMDYTDSIDPNNRRTTPLRNYIVKFRRLSTEIEQLELRRRERKITRQELMSLGCAYYELGQIGIAANILRGFIDELRDAQDLKVVAQVLLDARQYPDAEKAFAKYLKLVPQGDIGAWCELAKVQHKSGKKQAALNTVRMALQLDQTALIAILRRDHELYEIAAPLFRVR